MEHLESTAPKPFVFVLMPFDDSFRDIYELGIKAACEEAGAYSERIDEQLFTENMLDRIYNQIAKADLVVADMSGRNPNVFYEVGYAHALDKKVVLLTQNADDIPFDLKHYPHIVYEGHIVKLKEELAKRVQWFLKQPPGPVLLPSIGLKSYIEDFDLAEAPGIPAEAHRGGTYSWRERLNVHNPEEGRFDKEVFTIGFITPEGFSSNVDELKYGLWYPVKQIVLPDKQCLHLIDNEFSLYPGGWVQINIGFDTMWNLDDIAYYRWPLAIRIFSTAGTRNLPFTLLVQPLEY